MTGAITIDTGPEACCLAIMSTEPRWQFTNASSGWVRVNVFDHERRVEASSGYRIAAGQSLIISSARPIDAQAFLSTQSIDGQQGPVYAQPYNPEEI